MDGLKLEQRRLIVLKCYNNSESEQVKLCSISQYIGNDNEMDRVSKERKLILSPFL